MTVANISAKNFDPETKYIPFKTIMTNSTKPKEIPFIHQNLLKEVKQLPRKTKVKYIKICLTTLTTFASISILGIPTFAETIPQVVEVVNQTGVQTTTDLIVPEDILVIGKWAIGILAAIIAIMAIIFLQLAGGWRMLRKRKEASEWTTDILKGLVQAMLAPIIVVTITLICYLLFANVPYFTKPL